MHRSRAFVAALLVFVLALGCAAPALGATASDVQAHRDKAAKARAKAAAAEQLADKLKSETAVLDDKIDKLQAEASALEPQIAEASSRTKRLKGEVTKLTGEVRALESEIASTTAEYETQQALLADRVEATYKQGDWFYLDVILGSTDFADLITRTELVSRVIRSNSNLASALADTRESLSAAKTRLDRSLKAVQLKRREAQTVENRLRELKRQRQSRVNAQEAIYDQKSALMVESKANAKRLRAIAASEEAESNRIAAELAGSGSGQYNGVMAWPVPGYFTITSKFGWRIHPIFGTRKFHTGIDIGSGGGPSINGAAIVAAGDGTVIYTGYRGGYGNTVMIDHGNGVVTLYAHQQSGGIRVSKGQSVSKGDRIGTVGSTGYSTGAHLHFEVRVNGNPKNPMGYL